ncbi:MAG: hypothetical protein WC205_07115 [Opitutaceae bacterium]
MHDSYGEAGRQPEEALSLFRSLAAQAEAPEVSRLTQLGAVEQGKLDAAAALIVPPVLADPRSAPEARDLLAAIQKKKAGKTASAPDAKLLVTARGQVKRGDSRAARVTLQKVIATGQSHPQFAAASLITASWERELGRPKDAVLLLEGLHVFLDWKASKKRK